jgi:hypothetical protein
MKCPKCGYTSFPYLDSCGKCGHGLAEQRAAMGIYGLRPDPPDLLLAYQAEHMEVMAATPTQPVSVPGIDLGNLDAIELELAEAESAGPAPQELEAPADAAPDFGPTLELKSVGEAEFPLVEPNADQVSRQEMVLPQPLDLSTLGDLTLVLESAADLGDGSSESAETPRKSPEVSQVYDLDLDEDLDTVPLGSVVEDPRADDAGQEIVEYTLEIEDELEVDEDEVEEDDEAEEEDVDNR